MTWSKVRGYRYNQILKAFIKQRHTLNVSGCLYTMAPLNCVKSNSETLLSPSLAYEEEVFSSTSLTQFDQSLTIESTLYHKFEVTMVLYEIASLVDRMS